MERAAETGNEARDIKRAKVTNQPDAESVVELLVGLRTAASGRIRQLTSSNIANQLAMSVGDGQVWLLCHEWP